ncbi:MAG TPA: T9SS type A sorting domain-containing protein [Bacteroidales bacterium]|nr:T9SS type A sorting domain-containing protein [Bacteroidales bacterium]
MKLFIKRHFLLMLLAMGMMIPAYAQITIKSSDMPIAGDTLRKSNSVDISGVDFEATGAGYVWDFSEFQPVFQTVDTFVSVSSVPILYQLVFFYTNAANLAQKYTGINLDTLVGVSLTDPYRFFKNTSSSYTDVGFALTLNSIPVPLKFDNADVLYKFPLNYGHADSSVSGVGFGLPNLGYINIDRKRVNVVDGWGSLTTSYGTYDVLRLRSTVKEVDSIYVDSLQFGTAITRNYVEYKWLGTGHGEPLLQATIEGPLITVAWLDSITGSTVGIKQPVAFETRLSVAPNPMAAESTATVHLDRPDVVSMTIFDLSGKRVAEIFNGRLPAGISDVSFNNRLKPGIYLLRLTTSEKLLTEKLIVQ